MYIYLGDTGSLLVPQREPGLTTDGFFLLTRTPPTECTLSNNQRIPLVKTPPPMEHMMFLEDVTSQ